MKFLFRFLRASSFSLLIIRFPFSLEQSNQLLKLCFLTCVKSELIWKLYKAIIPVGALKSLFCVAVFVVADGVFVWEDANAPAPTAKLEATATKASNFVFLFISSYKW